MPMSRRSALEGEAQRARALRAAARPHEGGAGAGRLAARPTNTPSAARACASTRARRCRRSCISTLFHPLDDYYGLAPLEAAAVAVDTHNAAANWNKALLDNAARPSGALVYAGADGAVLSDEQFERLKQELDRQLPGHDECRAAAAARRRARLEGDVAVAQGHGFHGGEARRRARDRAGLRRAADAARHSRRQHLFELPGGQPRVLAADRAAARPTASAPRSRNGWRRRSARGLRSPSTPTRSRRCRADRAALWERVSKAPFLTVNEKRAAIGYGRSRAAIVVRRRLDAMPDLIETFTARGDLAHLALFLWATSATALAAFALARTRRRRAGASTISCASSRASTTFRRDFGDH